MKRYKFLPLLIGVFLTSLLGTYMYVSAPRERFVEVAEKSLPKSAMLYVPTVITVLSLSFDGEKFRIDKSTETVNISGAGVFVSPYGHILTCAHLFDNGESGGIPYTSLYNGRHLPMELLYKDVKRDLAIVKVEEGEYSYAHLADPRKLKVGQEVMAIGNPLGLEFSVSHGIISYLNRDFSFAYNTTQSDAFINPGNSGGPLFDLNGDLVGINSFMISPVDAAIFTGLGFSRSSAQIIEFLTKFRQIDAVLPKYGLEYFKKKVYRAFK